MNVMQLKNVALDVIVRFSDQAIVSGGNFVLGLLAARFLGPAHFGTFAITWSVWVFFLGVQWASIIAPMQSDHFAIGFPRQESMFGSLLFQSLVLGLFCGVVTLIFSWSLSVITLTLPVCSGIIIASLLIVLQDFIRRWFLFTERPRMAIFCDTIRYSAPIGVILLATSKKEFVAVDYLFLMGGAAFISCCLSLQDFKSMQVVWKNIQLYLRRYLRQGSWLLLLVVLQFSIANAPIYALAAMDTTATAGGYRVALYLMTPVIVLTEALETFLPLRASQAVKRGGTSALMQIMWRWCLPIFLFCSVFVGTVFLFKSELLVLAFGLEYQIYAPILLPLALAMLFQIVNYFINVSLRVCSASSYIFYGELLAAGCLVLMYIAMPLGKVGLGAAYFALGSQLIKFVFLTIRMTFILKKTYPNGSFSHDETV